MHQLTAEIRRRPSVDRVRHDELIRASASGASVLDAADDGYLTRLMTGSRVSYPAGALVASVNQSRAEGFRHVRLIRTGRGRAVQTAPGSTERNETVRQVAVPLPFVVVDHNIAFLDDPDGDRAAGVVVVRDDACVAGLAACHDLLWSLSALEIQGPAAALPPDLMAILGELASGATDAQAARNLHISSRTLSRHVAKLFEHLGARNRLEAGVVATRQGLV